MSETAAKDDLFQPSLRGAERQPLAAGERPWRLGSQFYVAFFGGALAAGAIAWVNAGRLGVPMARRRLIPVVALGGLAATILAATLTGSDAGNANRLIARVAGVAAFGLLYLIQNPFDRVYHAFLEGDDESVYDRLWGPGLAATVGLGLLQVGIVAIVLGAL